MLTKTLNRFGDFGIFTDTFIPGGTVLFSWSDWIEDEQSGWKTLTTSETMSLPEAEREIFLRYGYDVSFTHISGPVSTESVRHISNFMNHSCEPNMRYDDWDNIVAMRGIEPGEELTIDYGNFIVNMDQPFDCRCGTPSCRGRIRQDDWKLLIARYGINFPRFMQPAIFAEMERRARKLV